MWIYDDESGDPDQVTAFVLLCAAAFELTGAWGFCWAHSCSKPNLDSAGGGAQIIDLGKREATEWLDCQTWLQSWLTTHLSGPKAETALAASVSDRAEVQS